MKYFISYFDPESAEAALSKIDKIDSIVDSVYGVNNKLTNISYYTTKLDDIEKLVNDKIESLNVPSTRDRIDADLSARISNLEALTTQLNQKLVSLSTIPKPNHPTPQYPTNNRNLSQSPVPNPSSSTLLILGDSNTRHVKIDDTENTTTRIPTMLSKILTL